MANAYAPTFSTLLLETQDICENTNAEFVNNIPNFIWRAQDQLQRDLGLDFWRDYDLTAITTSAITRSADWLIVRSIYLPTQNKFLEKRHLDYVRGYGGSTGQPKVWAEDGETTLLVAPAPSASFSARLEFFKRLPALGTLNESNWLTNNVGDLLLLLTLINAQSYLVSPERMQEFLGLYQSVLQSAQTELRDSERRRDQPVRAAPRPSMQPGTTA